MSLLRYLDTDFICYLQVNKESIRICSLLQNSESLMHGGC